MPYEFKWGDEGTEVIFHGKLSYEDIREADDMHYGDARFDKIKYQLYDFSRADLSQISINHTKQAAAHDVASISYKPNFKVALVTLDSYTRTLCEKYIDDSIKLRSSWSFAIFDNYAEAKSWCTQ